MNRELSPSLLYEIKVGPSEVDKKAWAKVG